MYMWWITGAPIWHECFLLYLIPLWRCFGSCVHKVFPHLSHSKTCQNRVCRTSASHWGWPCFWSTYLTSWSNGVPMRFDTILLNWSSLTVRCRCPACRASRLQRALWPHFALGLTAICCDLCGSAVSGRSALGHSWGGFLPGRLAGSLRDLSEIAHENSAEIWI